MLGAVHNQSEAYEVDLKKVLSEILETYRAAWPDILFRLNISETACGLGGGAELPCYGHETALRMIFSNLIKNSVEAVEASETTGEIEINAAYHDDFLNITIRDSGVFDNSQKPHGNGLGLAICRSLASGLGARLSVSQTKEGGCAVVVSLRTSCPTFA
jgi:signal transduction histidine kinase